MLLLCHWWRWCCCCCCRYFLRIDARFDNIMTYTFKWNVQTGNTSNFCVRYKCYMLLLGRCLNITHLYYSIWPVSKNVLFLLQFVKHYFRKLIYSFCLNLFLFFFFFLYFFANFLFLSFFRLDLLLLRMCVFYIFFFVFFALLFPCILTFNLLVGSKLKY